MAAGAIDRFAEAVAKAGTRAIAASSTRDSRMRRFIVDPGHLDVKANRMVGWSRSFSTALPVRSTPLARNKHGEGDSQQERAQEGARPESSAACGDAEQVVAVTARDVVPKVRGDGAAQTGNAIPLVRVWQPIRTGLPDMIYPIKVLFFRGPG